MTAAQSGASSGRNRTASREEQFLHVFDKGVAFAFDRNTELARVATARAALVLVFVSQKYLDREPDWPGGWGLDEVIFNFVGRSASLAVGGLGCEIFANSLSVPGRLAPFAKLRQDLDIVDQSRLRLGRCAPGRLVRLT